MKLEGKKVIVTGASRGLGRALSEVLAERGAEVVMVARRAGPLEDAAAPLSARGLRVHTLAADVGARDAGARIAGAAHAMAGVIDVVIHNASTLGPTPLAALADTRDEDLEAAFAVNVLGPFRLTRALVGGMVQRGSGVIVHISSDAAIDAYPTWGAYGASKAALDHLSRTWAEELRDTGVRVVSVDPGDMDTEMHAAALPDADRATLAKPADVAEAIARILEGDAPSGSRVRVRS